MGAEQFRNLETGKDASEAFRKAVRQAKYEHGHGGYSGSIAEKHEFKLLNCPVEVTEEVLEAIEGYGRSEALEKHASWFERAEKIADDKWGPAVALEIPEDNKFGERFRVKGEKLFVFFGWASS